MSWAEAFEWIPKPKEKWLEDSGEDEKRGYGLKVAMDGQMCEKQPTPSVLAWEEEQIIIYTVNT